MSDENDAPWEAYQDTNTAVADETDGPWNSFKSSEPESDQPWLDYQSSQPAPATAEPIQPHPELSSDAILNQLAPARQALEARQAGYMAPGTELTTALAQGGKRVLDVAMEPLVKVSDYISVAPQTVADAMDTVKAGVMSAAPGSTKSFTERLGEMPTRTPTTGENVASGVQNAVAESMDFFTSPIGAATLLAGPLAKLGSVAIPEAAHQAVTAAFVTQMAAGAPDQFQAFLDAKRSGDNASIAKALTGLGLTATFIGMGAKGLKDSRGRVTEPTEQSGIATPEPTATQLQPSPEPRPAASSELQQTSTAPAEAPAGVGSSIGEEHNALMRLREAGNITPDQSVRLAALDEANAAKQAASKAAMTSGMTPEMQAALVKRKAERLAKEEAAKGASPEVSADASTRPKAMDEKQMRQRLAELDAAATANAPARMTTEATDAAIAKMVENPETSKTGANPGYTIGESVTKIEQLEALAKGKEQYTKSGDPRKTVQSQFFREAIERATKSGSAGKPMEGLADYDVPLDYKNNKDVAKWLLNNSERIGLHEDSVSEIKTSLEKQPTPAAETPATKEPWQMTKKEYVDQSDRQLGGRYNIRPIHTKSIEAYKDAAEINHKSAIVDAIEKGKQVPPEVLKDYPDLKTSTAEPASDWTSATESSEMHSGVSIPRFSNRKMSPLDKVTASHSAKLQKSMDEARRAQKEIKREVPSDRRQGAISIYREANGDMALLKEWETKAKQKWMRDAAKDAQTVTPKELAIEAKAKAAYEVMEKRGNTNDVLKSHRENYVTHIWDVKKPGSGWGGGMLQQRFKFSKARTFNTFFEGDQAGFKPKTLAIGKLLPAYLHEMNKVIADRQFVSEMMKEKASDGEPLGVQRGNTQVVDSPGGKAVLVQPRSPREADTGDYETMENQPALHDWIWQSEDSAGNPVFVKADIALHPEAYRRINAMLGQSALRTWYREPVGGTAQIPRAIARGLDTAQSAMKREMFGLLAPFHQVQEGTHAVGHLVNPFFGIEKIDFRKPGQMDAAKHGLMLLPNRASSRSYLEGVGTKSSLLSRGIRKVPAVGEAIADVIDGYQDYLFHQYIPGLKYKTYEAMLGRNMKLYAKELASGEMAPADVKITSAEQANAAYGHLNYALLDRNPTIQHIIQIGALAPDFLEARARFAGQAVKGLSSKVGHEQLKAVAIIAAAQAGTAFALSSLLGVPYDPKHPFEVIYKGRRYAMRSVPEDIFTAFKDTRQFLYSRVNPLIVKGGIQLATGLNYRGEKTTPWETITELLAGYIPITARWIPGVRSLTETSRNSPITPLQQLEGSLGLRVSRYSPISETYKLAGDWMEKQKIPKDRGSYPISKYQKLRYALEDGDLDRARDAYAELKKTMPPGKISSGFRESVNHPFTGSKSSDAKFAASLKGYDKELYLQALRTRRNILGLYGRAAQ